jgi:REP element-mobilizing transposase RayT
MSDSRHKRHHVSALLDHIVCPAQYRRVVVRPAVATVLTEVCLDIAKRYEIVCVESGTDPAHGHFLVQSVPTYSPTQIVHIIKSLTASEIVTRVPAVKKPPWGGILVPRLLHPSWRSTRERRSPSPRCQEPRHAKESSALQAAPSSSRPA